MKSRHIVIDAKAILILILLGAVIFVSLKVLPLIFALFIATILTMGMLPAVDYLESKKLPRGLSVVLVYGSILILSIILISLAFIPMFQQTIQFANNFPKYLNSVSELEILKPVSKDLNQKIIEQSSVIVGKALEKTVDAVSGVFLIFTVLVLTIYMLIDFHNIKKFMASLLPKKEENKALEVLREIETKLGAWLRGELLLMSVIGGLTYIGLFALDIEYALSLALIAGILEIVPMIGPTIALVPALIVGFSISPVHGFGVLGLYIVIQQLENNLIVPKIMQKSVGFNPLVTLIAIILGGSLFGVLGSLLAVPATLVVTIIARNYIKL